MTITISLRTVELGQASFNAISVRNGERRALKHVPHDRPYIIPGVLSSSNTGKDHKLLGTILNSTSSFCTSVVFGKLEGCHNKW